MLTVMIFTSMIPLSAGTTAVAEVDELADPAESGPKYSTYAVDTGSGVFSSVGGVLYRESDVIAVGGIGQILCSGGDVYYARANEIYTYSLSGGRTKRVYSAGDDIISFALCDHGSLYVYSKDALSVDGRNVLDMTGSMSALTEEHSWRSVALSDCLFFELDADRYLLYFENPDFDEEDAYNVIDPYLILTYQEGKDYLYFYSEPVNTQIGETSSYDASTSYTIGKSSFPLADYPVGSFFTKNGKSCTCHNQGICVASGSKCNCMRFWPTGVSSTCEIDLMSSQCWGFAEFCEYKAYGYYDKASAKSFYNAFGSKKSAKTWTASEVKEVMTSVGAGGHLRVGGHSEFVIAVTSTGFITYECNKSTANNYCVIYTTSWTWDSFYNKRYANDILWYYMPTNVTNTPIIDNTYEPGNYQVKATSLNLRESDSTSSAKLTSIPNDTIIQITEFNSSYTWGKTTYNGYTGWVSLDYVFYLKSTVSGIYISSLPDKTVYFTDDKFSTAGLEVYAQFVDGTTSEISGYSCTGYNMAKAGNYTVTITYSGYTATFPITVQEKQIYPTSIKLDVNSLALLEGDSYSYSTTILPKDANMLDLTWASSDPSVATVSKTGALETHKEGEVTITVYTESQNVYASCSLLVVRMPSGTSWSVTSKGEPLSELPLGITTLDYSVRYRVKSGSKYGDWVYVDVGKDLPVSQLAGKTVQYQYRAITVSFISDGRDVISPFAVDMNTVVDLNKYQLTKEGSLFAGWFKTGQAAISLDQNQAYRSTVEITGDTAFYAGWIELSKLDADTSDRFAASSKVDSFGFAGAELCDDEGGVGIRFFSRIGSDLVEKLKGLNNKCEFGSVVVMKDKMSSNLVISGSSTVLSSNKPVKVAGTKIYTTYTGASPDDADDYILYDVLVTGYSDKYITRDIAVRPYIIYRDVNGISHTHYFTCTGDSTASGAYYNNLYAVALEAYETSDNKIWIRENILNKVK